MAEMITKRSKGYVLYLYTQIKNKTITVYAENKSGVGAEIMVSEETLHFEYVPKE